MTISVVERAPLATELSFTVDEMQVTLADGRRPSMPLAWFPRLAHASIEQRQNYELMGDGEGIHWPYIDEDLSVEGLLR